MYRATAIDKLPRRMFRAARAAGRLAALLAGCTAWPAGAVETGTVFDNWTVRCESASEASAEQCFISQSIALREGGQRVLNVDVGFAPQRADAVAVITLPLGISLPPGASIQVDGHPVHHFEIERCEPGGCRGGIVLAEPLLGWLLAGEQARVAFFDAERRRLEIPLRLAGLSAGLEALRPHPGQ